MTSGQDTTTPSVDDAGFEMMSPEERRRRFEALTNRDELAGVVAKMVAQGYPRAELMDVQPLSVGEHLELLALGAHIARHDYRHPSDVHRAVVAGATWEQVARAVGASVDDVRVAYYAWARQQRKTHGETGVGLDEAQYAEAMQRLGGEETVPRRVVFDLTGGVDFFILGESLEEFASVQRWKAENQDNPESRREWADRADALRSLLDAALGGTYLYRGPRH